MREIRAFLIFLTILNSPIFANEFKVAVDQAYFPYMYREGKLAKGLYPDILEAIFKRLKKKGARTTPELVVKPLPWARAVKMGLRGTMAIGGAYRNEERMKIYDYSDSLFEERILVFVKKGNEFSYKNIQDLKGKTVGVNLGWSYGQQFETAKKEKLFKIEKSKDNKVNFIRLVKERGIACFLADEISARVALRELGYQDKVISLKIPFSINSGHLIINKKNNKKALLKNINQTISQLKSDGTYHQIVRNFIKMTQ